MWRWTLGFGVLLICMGCGSDEKEPEAKLSCGEDPALGDCECSLGGKPYFSYSRAVDQCSAFDFEPGGLCCISPQDQPYPGCACHATHCLEDVGKCECRVHDLPSGGSSCTPGRWQTCCKSTNGGGCVCQNAPCGINEAPIANCDVSQIECSPLDRPTTTCSAEAIQAAKNQ